MPKRPMKFSVRIPNYRRGAGKAAWGNRIRAAIAREQARSPVRYSEDDKLEVEIRFHLRDRKLTILDVDNRVKTVLDALQRGKRKHKNPLIPNDNQVYRIVAEKRLPPKKDREAPSILTISRYTHHRGTARKPREYRKHPPGQ